MSREKCVCIIASSLMTWTYARTHGRLHFLLLSVGWRDVCSTRTGKPTAWVVYQYIEYLILHRDSKPTKVNPCQRANFREYSWNKKLKGNRLVRRAIDEDARESLVFDCRDCFGWHHRTYTVDYSSLAYSSDFPLAMSRTNKYTRLVTQHR